MEKQKTFNKLWEAFMKNKLTNRSPERIDRYEIARMFFEFGFSRGVLK